MKHAKQMIACTEYFALILNKAFNLVILRQQPNTVLIIGILVWKSLMIWFSSFIDISGILFHGKHMQNNLY